LRRFFGRMKYMNKKVSFPIAIIIIVILAVIVGGGSLVYQYWWLPREEAKNSQKPVACTEEAKVCPDGSAVGRTGPNCEFALCSNKDTHDGKVYNHAGEVVKINQNNGEEYLDVNFIKFVRFTGVGKPLIVYGDGEDEKGDCDVMTSPDGYCIVDNDKTIKSYKIARNIEILPAYYPFTPFYYEELGNIFFQSPYYQLQIEDNVIQKMSQIYIP